MADKTTTNETAVGTPTDADLIRIVQGGANLKMTRAQNRKALTTVVPADNTVLTWDAALADWVAEVSPALDASLLASAITPTDGDFLAANQLVAGVATPKKMTRAENRQNLTSGISPVANIASPRDGDFLRYTDLTAATLTVSNITAATDPVVTTTTHGLISGATVTIAGVTGMTGANGTWPVVVVSPTTFQIIGTTTAGVYAGTVTAVVPTGDWLPDNPRWRLIPDTKYTKANPINTSQITVVAGLADFVVGSPIRVKQTAVSYVYGIITAYSATTLTIAGAPLVFGGADDIEEIAVGNGDMLFEKLFYIQGTFQSGTDSATKLADDGQYYLWRKRKAYLVSFSATVTSDGGNMGRVTPVIGGSVVSTENTNTGPIFSATSGTWVHNSAVSINSSNYAIEFGDAVELQYTEHASGSSGEEDLHVLCVFVFE